MRGHAAGGALPCLVLSALARLSGVDARMPRWDLGLCPPGAPAPSMGL
jgi:hypothetical protein